MAYANQYEIEVMLSRADLRHKVEVAGDGDGWFDLTVCANNQREAVRTKLSIQEALVGVSNIIIKADFVGAESEPDPGM